VGQLKVGNGTRRLGIRADMDALPIEATGLPYASQTHGDARLRHDGHPRSCWPPRRRWPIRAASTAR
jgi:metal-dependent amidase/aminoacylase/carboxypeptidase family protein